MIRRYNFTNRTRVLKKSVHISTYTGENGIQSFDAEVDLEGYRLPPGSNIYLEAYYRNSMMRFSAGTYSVEQTKYHCSGLLSELQDPQVNFRVKVVDSSQNIGRIVALADKIQVFNQDAKQVVQVGLLPVKFTDLKDQVWALEILDDNSDPVLCVNKTLDTGNLPISELVRTSPLFLTLVYPAVVRQVLEALLIERQGDTREDDLESWEYKWMAFAESHPGIERHPETDDKAEIREWIERVVLAFCSRNKIRAAFEKYIAEMQ